MIRLLRWLIWGDAHPHQWEEIATGNIISRGIDLPTGHYYDLRCKKCGDVVRRSLMT